MYNIDTNSNEAYIISEGEVNLFSRDGFLLASLSNGEIFGETSVITGKKRSITAKAGANGLKVKIIPKKQSYKYFTKRSHFRSTMEKNTIKIVRFE